MAKRDTSELFPMQTYVEGELRDRIVEEAGENERKVSAEIRVALKAYYGPHDGNEHLHA